MMTFLAMGQRAISQSVITGELEYTTAATRRMLGCCANVCVQYKSA